MGNEEEKDEWLAVGEDGSSPDISRETAAFERERARLVRDHPGKIVVIRFDDIVGVYDNPNEAAIDSHRRFGWGRMVMRVITEHDEPDYIGNVDPNHPSCRRVD